MNLNKRERERERERERRFEVINKVQRKSEIKEEKKRRCSEEL